jgi:hypothetical protein
LRDAEETIQNSRAEKRVVNKVVPYSVDVRVHHQRVNEAENQHHPKRRVRIQKEEADEICEMKETGQCGDRVPTRVRKDARVRRRTFDREDVSGSSHGNR